MRQFWVVTTAMTILHLLVFPTVDGLVAVYATSKFSVFSEVDSTAEDGEASVGGTETESKTPGR